MRMPRSDAELYAEDILVNVLQRTRFGYAVRDALADRLEQILAEVADASMRLEARKALKKSVKKPTI